MRVNLEIKLDEEQQADIDLFRKTFEGVRLVKYSSTTFFFQEQQDILGIGNRAKPTKKSCVDLVKEEEEEWLSFEQIRRLSPFMNKIISIRKEPQLPYVLELKSGLFIWVASLLRTKEEASP